MARLFDDGSNEKLLNASTAVVTGYPLTLAIWARVNDVSIGQTVLGVFDHDTSDNFFRIAVQANVSGDPVRAHANSSGNTRVNDAGTVIVDTWTHAAGVFISSSSNIAYHNGVAGSDVFTDTPTPSGLESTAIGIRWSSAENQPMSGDLAEGGVWNVALDAAEIVTLAKGYSPLFVRPGSLVFYLPMIRGQLTDYIGNVVMTATGTTVSNHHSIIYPSPPHVITAPTAAAGRIMSSLAHRGGLAGEGGIAGIGGGLAG